jgi:hypothetical protein
VWVHGLTDFDSLEMGDRVTFNNVAHKFLRIYETLFLQYEAGLVERSLFDNAHRFSDQMLEYPGLRSYWTHNRRRFSERFGAYLDDRIALPSAQSRAAEGSIAGGDGRVGERSAVERASARPDRPRAERAIEEGPAAGHSARDGGSRDSSAPSHGTKSSPR